ncbi:MAG: hypothetical protein M3462_14625, partial [Chloroflexota bacterium]|nr:hypothetical protein [Chloroflexota bacterium]
MASVIHRIIAVVHRRRMTILVHRVFAVIHRRSSGFHLVTTVAHGRVVHAAMIHVAMIHASVVHAASAGWCGFRQDGSREVLGGGRPGRCGEMV